MFCQVRDSTHFLLLGRPQKIPENSEAEEVILVWQFSGSQLIKLIKSVTSLVLNKKEQAGNTQVGAISKAQK